MIIARFARNFVKLFYNSTFSFQLPKPKAEDIIGYCYICPKTSKLPDQRAKDTFREHYRWAGHNLIVAAEHRCPECFHLFRDKNKLENHYCVQAKQLSLDEPLRFCTYMLRSNDSFVAKLVKNLTPLEIYGLCFNEKFGLPKIFPPLWASGGGRRRNVLYLEYNSDNSSNFMVKALTENYLKTQENGLYLDKFVEIKSMGVVKYRFTPDYTKPIHSKLKVTEEGSRYLVQLATEPKLVPQVPLEFADEDDSLVYREYVESAQYLPHSYPSNETKDLCVFRAPQKAKTKLLSNYVGMSGTV